MKVEIIAKKEEFKTLEDLQTGQMGKIIRSSGYLKVGDVVVYVGIDSANDPTFLNLNIQKLQWPSSLKDHKIEILDPKQITIEL